ncbi:fungal-specific transcription factor domain-containing protein [Bisporella sp. PMI_857]|nr:fungal-specific transcription factor domain-containing protein [Bisporella sp. PMI_857]
METITIPSPTAFLTNSPVTKPSSPPRAQLPKPRKQNTATKAATTAKKNDGVVKPKQSKSRNAKRLKCDETKPACQQCHKRNVTCGGYKKDFKWRPFEETTFVNKPTPAKTKRSSIVLDKPPDTVIYTSPTSDEASTTPNAEGDNVQMENSFFNAAAPSPPAYTFSTPDLNFNHPPMFDMSTPPSMRELPRPRFDADHITSSLSSLFDDTNSVPLPSSTPSPRPSFSGQSPRLIDLLLPGSELNARPGSVVIPPLSTSIPSLDLSSMTLNPMLEQPSEMDTGMMQNSTLDEDIEEIIRSPQTTDRKIWTPFQGSVHRPSAATMASPDRFNQIYRQPEMKAGSKEMLMRRFDRDTCGILSVKDGPTENPWRTLIWPLTREEPALYHAIASMTAFHSSKMTPALRVEGMEHMRRSIRSLASGIEKMRTETALATTLVLAFSESWDQHISTGIEHLRGAKILVNQALVAHQKSRLRGDDLTRLKFLCNTWVYMDVIARLTSVEDDEGTDFGHDDALWPFNASLSPSSPTQTNTELDPLMGCAATLFPLIGRAANLCRKVRKLKSNSVPIISQAMELRQAIEQWQPPPGTAFDEPEDPTSEIQHALQTAEAYRFATLLYLHQAVPEIPSLSSAELARKVLVYLATVPLSSRLIIVQIYPLLAAGCEAWDPEDRQWVESRWSAMASRMWIGNIDRCWEVQQEVWSRRDATWKSMTENQTRRRPGQDMIPFHSESSKRKYEEELVAEDGFNFSDLLVGNGVTGQKRQRTSGSFGQGRKRRDDVADDWEWELTVRGPLHWVGVMKDWEWEILLG